MSLDVYLVIKGSQNFNEGHKAIFIREKGQTKEITRREWNERYPDKEPVYIKIAGVTDEVYTANITHNLAKMAGHVECLYQALWRPEDLNIKNAKELIPHLEDGLRLLNNDPDKYKKFNPVNGWGNYERLVSFIKSYLRACRNYPKAEVWVSR